MATRTAALLLVIASSTVRAQVDGTVPAAAAIAHAPVDSRNYVNLRIGGSTQAARPELCLEVTPHALFAVEACGTGSGFLHHDPVPQISHFRGKLNVRGWQTSFGRLVASVNAGFAELQVGEDGEGFHFSGVGPSGVETAGPELGLSIKALMPVGAGLELVGELGMSASYFGYAPLLVRPQSRLQPAISLTFGFGF